MSGEEKYIDPDPAQEISTTAVPPFEILGRSKTAISADRFYVQVHIVHSFGISIGVLRFHSW